MEKSDVSERSRGVALALSGVLGMFGCHRFYVGKIGSGLVQLLTMGGLGIWYVYDVILVASGSFRDAEGRRVANWGESDMPTQSPGRADDRIEMLMDEIDHLRADMGEVVERMDFMERVFARHQERDRLPGERSYDEPV